MRVSQNLQQFTLQSLINRLGEGRFVIPDFQRDFEWESKHIQALIRSIFLDYYIGNLLLWNQQESFDDLSCQPIYGYPSDQQPSPEHIVLDGQQRLTAMHYMFFAPEVAPNKKKAKRVLYFIKIDRFMNSEYDHAFESHSSKYGEQVLAEENLQYSEHLFPLAIVGKGGQKYYRWFERYVDYWKKAATAAAKSGQHQEEEDARNYAATGEKFANEMEDLLTEYKVSYVELNRNLELEKICDIFTQINRNGVQLDIFDLLNALVKPKGIQLRTHLWKEAEAKGRFFSEIREMNVYVLQVMSIMRQIDCSPKFLYYLIPERVRTYRDRGGSSGSEKIVESKEHFETLWDQAVMALHDSLVLLSHPQEFGAISPRFLPYAAILPAFAAIKNSRDSDGIIAQRKLRLWYWASVFTNRYTGPVWSTTSRDYIDVHSWFADDEKEPSVINEFRENLSSLDLREESRAGNAVYRGIFNLFILNGARDWIKGTVPQHDDLDAHHIVPHEWGKENGLVNEINTILNRTPLTSETNRNFIKNRLPNEYIPDLIRRSSEKDVRKTFEDHLISSKAFSILCEDPFTPAHFEEFILERQITIRNTIERLLIKERLDLDPNLREMDEAIEMIELALRSCIDGELDGSIDEVKGLHFFPRVNERIAGVLRRNTALDPDHYAILAGKLEYFDLWELEDTITNGRLWDRFADRFGTKEGLSMRFGQLGDLRNAIRHSRTADEVTRKDGQAAIAWFHAALKLEN